MKILIGAACVAAIAIAIYLIGGDYLRARQMQKHAFIARCDELSSDANEADFEKRLADLPGDERRRLQREANRCLEWMNTGNIPN